MLTATMLWLGTASAADADCAMTYTAHEVDAALEEALLSFAVLDQDAFDVHASTAMRQVDCLDEAISPSLAAGLHRVEGIRLVVEGRNGDARERFRAALSLEPAHRLPDTIAPEGGKLASTYAAGRELPIRSRLPVSVPAPLSTLVDGHPVSTRPDAGPYVLQVLDPGGAVVVSDYIASGEPSLDLPGVAPAVAASAALPDDTLATAPTVAMAPFVQDPTMKSTGAPVKPVASEAFSSGVPLPPPSALPTATSRGGNGLLIAGIASGVVAGGLYGTAVGARMQFDQNPSESSWYLTNGAYFGSVGTGALSAVLLSTFLVSR